MEKKMISPAMSPRVKWWKSYHTLHCRVRPDSDAERTVDIPPDTPFWVLSLHVVNGETWAFLPGGKGWVMVQDARGYDRAHTMGGGGYE